jgi:hypothetical protein
MSYPQIDNLAKIRVSHRANRDSLFKSFILSLRLYARPKPLNRVLPLIIFIFSLFAPLFPCHAETDPAKILANNVILYEDWENKNFKNWDDDFRKGDTTIETDPVHE